MSDHMVPLTPQQEEAVARLLAAFGQGFTGSVTFDCEHGQPMVIRQTETKRFVRLRSKSGLS